jgi:PB1 domain
MSDVRSPASNFGQPPELYDDVYDMYNSRQRMQQIQQSSRSNSNKLPSMGQQLTGPPSTQGYISEEDEENMTTTSSQGGYDEPDFEMMMSRSATGRSSRRSRASNSGSTVMPAVPELSQLGAPVEVKKIRVKVHAEDSRYVIIAPNAQFGDFVTSVRTKFAIMQSFKIKVKDEGDMITMSDQDDLDIALDVAKEHARQMRSEMGKMEVSYP